MIGSGNARARLATLLPSASPPRAFPIFLTVCIFAPAVVILAAPAAVAVEAPPVVVSAEALQDEWPQPGGDAAHTGSRRTVGPGTGKVLWSVGTTRGLADANGNPLQGDFRTACAYGRIFAGTGAWTRTTDPGHHYYYTDGLAMDAGGLVWQREILNGRQNPVVADGKVFLGEGRALKAFSADTATLLWETPYENAYHTARTYGNGTLVAVADNNMGPYVAQPTTDSVLGLNATTGRLEWTRDVGFVMSGLTVHEDRVYVAARKGPRDQGSSLLALDLKTGAIVWKAEFADTWYFRDAAPTVTEADVFVVRTDAPERTRIVTKLDRATGSKLWDTKFTTTVNQYYYFTSWPIAGPDKLFVRTDFAELSALDLADGHVVWKVQPGGFPLMQGALTPKALYTAGSDGFVHAINPETGVEIWRTQTWQYSDRKDSGDICVIDGVLYTSSRERFFALDAGGPNLPPVAAFDVSPPPVQIGETVAFLDRSVDPDGEIENWTWRFGDGARSYDRNPAHAYAADGTYTATLTVRDRFRAEATELKQIVVGKPKLIAAKPPPPPPPPVTDWPMYQLDLAHKGFAGDEWGGDAPWTVRWELMLGGRFNHALAFADGSLFVGGTQDGAVLRVDAATGEVLWKTKTPIPSPASPVVSDGVVYIMSEGHGRLYALDAKMGEEKWNTHLGTIGTQTSPAVADGIVYVAGQDRLVAIRADSGEVVWNVQTPGWAPWPESRWNGLFGWGSSPIAAGGVVYVGTYSAGEPNCAFYAFDAATGDVRWKFQVEHPNRDWTWRPGPWCDVTPAALDGDRLYFGGGNHAYAVEAATGKLIWGVPTSSNLHGGPTVAGDVVLFANDGGNVIALLKDGNTLWYAPLGGGHLVYSAPVWPPETCGPHRGAPFCGTAYVSWWGDRGWSGGIAALNPDQWIADLDANAATTCLAGEGSTGSCPQPYRWTQGDKIPVKAGFEAGNTGAPLAHDGTLYFLADKGDGARLIALRVAGEPTARFRYDPATPTVTDTVTFEDASTSLSGNVVGWAWDFGDGTTSTERNPTHRYARSGSYTVRLTVQNDILTPGRETPGVDSTTRTLRVGLAASQGSGAPSAAFTCREPLLGIRTGIGAEDVSQLIRNALGDQRARDQLAGAKVLVHVQSNRDSASNTACGELFSASIDEGGNLGSFSAGDTDWDLKVTTTAAAVAAYLNSVAPETTMAFLLKERAVVLDAKGARAPVVGVAGAYFDSQTPAPLAVGAQVSHWGLYGTLVAGDPASAETKLKVDLGGAGLDVWYVSERGVLTRPVPSATFQTLPAVVAREIGILTSAAGLSSVPLPASVGAATESVGQILAQIEKDPALAAQRAEFKAAIEGRRAIVAQGGVLDALRLAAQPDATDEQRAVAQAKLDETVTKLGAAATACQAGLAGHAALPTSAYAAQRALIAAQMVLCSEHLVALKVLHEGLGGELPATVASFHADLAAAWIRFFASFLEVA